MIGVKLIIVVTEFFYKTCPPFWYLSSSHFSIFPNLSIGVLSTTWSWISFLFLFTNFPWKWISQLVFDQSLRRNLDCGHLNPNQRCRRSILCFHFHFTFTCMSLSFHFYFHSSCTFNLPLFHFFPNYASSKNNLNCGHLNPNQRCRRSILYLHFHFTFTFVSLSFYFYFHPYCTFTFNSPLFQVLPKLCII